MLLKLVKVVMKVLGQLNSFCAGIADINPGNFYQAQSQYGLKGEQLKRYVVCKKCHQVYFMRECIARCGTQLTSKPCSYLGLDRHVCGTPLLRSVELLSGRKIFYSFFNILLC